MIKFNLSLNVDEAVAIHQTALGKIDNERINRRIVGKVNKANLKLWSEIYCKTLSKEPHNNPKLEAVGYYKVYKQLSF